MKNKNDRSVAIVGENREKALELIGEARKKLLKERLEALDESAGICDDRANLCGCQWCADNKKGKE